MKGAVESSQALHGNFLSKPHPCWTFPQAQAPAWSSSFQPWLTLLHAWDLTCPSTALIGCVPQGKHLPGRQDNMQLLPPVPGATMEKSYVSVFLLLVAISCALAAKDTGKKETKETKETTAKPKLPQTLSRGKEKNKKHTPNKQAKCNLLNFWFLCCSKILIFLQFILQINFLVFPSPPPSLLLIQSPLAAPLFKAPQRQRAGCEPVVTCPAYNAPPVLSLQAGETSSSGHRHTRKPFSAPSTGTAALAYPMVPPWRPLAPPTIYPAPNKESSFPATSPWWLSTTWTTARTAKVIPRHWERKKKENPVFSFWLNAA